MNAEIKSLVDQTAENVKTLKADNEKSIKELTERLEKAETALNRAGPAANDTHFTSKTALVTSIKADEAFKNFLRKGAGGVGFEFKADVTTGTTNGVFPIVDQFVGRVLHDSSPLAGLVHTVTMSGGAPYTKVYNKNDAGAGRVAENGSRTKTDSNSTYKVEIKAPDVYAYPQVSLASIEDSFYDVEGEVLWSATDKIARVTSAEIINGTGFDNEQSLGILAASRTEQVVTGDTSVNRIDRLNVLAAAGLGIELDDLISLVYALPEQYHANAAFIVKGPTVALLRKLENDNGDKVWEPSNQLGQPARIFGYPVYIAPEMPGVGANAKSVLFGDFKQGVTMVHTVGLSVVVDLLTAPGHKKFHVRARLGSAPTDGRAIVALKHPAE